MIELANIVDMISKILAALASVGTLYLLWTRALPKLDEIHIQTNSLTEKLVIAEKSVSHAAGVIEGLAQGKEAKP